MYQYLNDSHDYSYELTCGVCGAWYKVTVYHRGIKDHESLFPSYTFAQEYIEKLKKKYQ